MIVTDILRRRKISYMQALTYDIISPGAMNIEYLSLFTPNTGVLNCGQK
jgi:hypothetical protein